jgi:hypothetical protein
MMSIDLATREGWLAIELTGMDAVYALKRGVAIPLDTITDVRVEPRQAMEKQRGIRAPGVAFPGRIAVGTWRGRGGRQFWCVHAAERVLVVELEHGEYRRLVLEVPDHEAEAGRIRKAAGLPERDGHGRIDHSGGHGSAIELDAA